MNGRKLFREYASYKGLDCKEFIEIIPEYYSNDVFKYKDSSGQLRETSINYKDMVHFIIKKLKITE